MCGFSNYKSILENKNFWDFSKKKIDTDLSFQNITNFSVLHNFKNFEMDFSLFQIFNLQRNISNNNFLLNFYSGFMAKVNWNQNFSSSLGVNLFNLKNNKFFEIKTFWFDS